MKYSVLEIPPDDLEGNLPQLFALNGFNVTIPYKVKIMENLDSLDQSARNHGAVNVVEIGEDGTRTGYNTDCIGFVRAMQAEGIAISGRVCVLGAGGVGRMFATECALRGCEVTLAVRGHSVEMAKNVATEIQAKIPNNISVEKITVQNIETLMGKFDLMIQATPVGMFPNVDEMPVDAKKLKDVKIVFDCIYNPKETKLMKAAKEAGCKVCGGMKMLVWQAAAAQEIWFGESFSEEQVQMVIDQMELQSN